MAGRQPYSSLSEIAAISNVETVYTTITLSTIQESLADDETLIVNTYPPEGYIYRLRNFFTLLNSVAGATGVLYMYVVIGTNLVYLRNNGPLERVLYSYNEPEGYPDYPGTSDETLIFPKDNKTFVDVLYNQTLDADTGIRFEVRNALNVVKPLAGDLIRLVVEKVKVV